MKQTDNNNNNKSQYNKRNHQSTEGAAYRIIEKLASILLTEVGYLEYTTKNMIKRTNNLIKIWAIN